MRFANSVWIPLPLTSTNTIPSAFVICCLQGLYYFYVPLIVDSTTISITKTLRFLLLSDHPNEPFVDDLIPLRSRTKVTKST